MANAMEILQSYTKPSIEPPQNMLQHHHEVGGDAGLSVV